MNITNQDFQLFVCTIYHHGLILILNDFRTESEADIKGIPDFWLTIFKNVGTLAEMVQEHDEPILKHLNDIKVNFLKSSPMVSRNTMEI